MKLFKKKEDDYDLFHKGNQLYDKKELHQAIDCFHKISDKNVRLMVDTHRMLGLCFIGLKSYESALLNFNFALEVDPNEYQTLIFKTKLLEELDNRTEFRESYATLMALRQEEFPDEDPEKWYESIDWDMVGY